MNPALLFFLPVILTSAVDPPQSNPSVSCSDELVTFSMCLSYVAMSPNNGTDSPSPQCCDDVTAAFANNSAVCLCYFIRQPDIMGFPLNSTKVMSLTTVCSLNHGNLPANFSLQTLCSGSSALPPLHSITGFESTKSPPLPVVGSSQGPSGSSSTQQEPAEELPTQHELPTSSVKEKNEKLHWVLLTFILCVATCLIIDSFMSPAYSIL